MTSFLSDHPGGAEVILKLSGKDATKEFDPIHSSDALEMLPVEATLGSLDPSATPESVRETATSHTSPPSGSSAPVEVETLLSLDEVENAAKRVLKTQAWSYFNAASDDHFSRRQNSNVFHQIVFRPRVFIPCTDCDTRTTLLGALKVQLPVFVAPAALARLAHQDGERAIAKACMPYGAMQLISNNASQAPEQIVEGASDDQVFGWQLYVQSNRRLSETMLRRIAKIPSIKFIALTLDAPIRGKWEDDLRLKAPAPMPPSSVQTTGSPSRESLFSGTATDLAWETTMPWLARHTNLPIVIKGIQTYEDAQIASQQPSVRGIILSNHGGRSLDGSPPALHTLVEIRRFAPEVFDKVDIWIDGGIKRGTDVLKALCLGAKAVGIGRAPLMGLAIGGQKGVERVLGILQDEIERTMRFLGVSSIAQLQPRHVSSPTQIRACLKLDPAMSKNDRTNTFAT